MKKETVQASLLRAIDQFIELRQSEWGNVGSQTGGRQRKFLGTSDRLAGDLWSYVLANLGDLFTGINAASRSADGISAQPIEELAGKRIAPSER